MVLGRAEASDPWRTGVRFECTACGACCTGAKGRVRLEASEVAGLAAALGLEEAAFREAYTREDEGLIVLRERPNPHRASPSTSTPSGPPAVAWDCVLLDDAGRCRAYAARPEQCRTYPFWFQTTRSADAWARTRAECPGIGQGPWVTPEAMLRLVQRSPELRDRPELELGGEDRHVLPR